MPVVEMRILSTAFQAWERELELYVCIPGSEDNSFCDMFRFLKPPRLCLQQCYEDD